MARVEPHLGAPVDIELEKLQPKFYLVKACDLEASGLTGYQDAIRPLRIAGNKNAVTARIQSIVTDKFVVMDFCLDSGERCSVPVTQYSFGENRWITF
ncbi:MAG: hypothetical protein IJ164_00275, partial [Duodenibacillus sp.]|nr:hypothetical protein [Duodenibacillus sp.]